MIRRLIGSVTERLQAFVREQSPEIYEVRGFRVVVENTRADIQTADVLARLDDALGLIERYQPWRLRHLKRDLSHFLIMRYACRGAYFPAERVCMTELTFLARRDITAAPVASSILHEGVHARVSRMSRIFGAGWQPADRAREERLCRKAELHFGLSLPADLGAPVIERARATLEMDDSDVAPIIDWRLAQERQALIDKQAADADRS